MTPPTARVRLLAVVILGAHLALSYSHNYHLGANDDRLWLYHTGAQIGRTADSDRLTTMVRRSLETSGANQNKLFRYDAREGYRSNYVMATTVYRVAAGAVRRATGDLMARDYPAYLARAMYGGFLLTYVIAALVFVIVVSTLADGKLLLGLVAAFTAIVVLETLFDLAGDSWWGLPVLLPDAQTSETFWQVFGPNFPGLILNPQVQMSPFGDTPRNHFILLTLALFTLRWRGAFAASYLLLLCMSFVHQSQTGLLSAYLLGADAVLRPRIFRSPTAILLALIIGTYLSRETLGGAIGIARPLVIVTIAILTAAGGLLIWIGVRRPASAALADRLDRLRQRLLRRGAVAADLLVIGGIWVTTFPVAAAINAMGSEVQSLYFWTQIHGRSLGILRPALLFGITLFALAAAFRRYTPAQITRATLVAAGLALIPSAYLAGRHSRTPIATLEHQLRDLDRQVGPTIDWVAIGAESEERIYYSLARTLDQATGAGQRP